MKTPHKIEMDAEAAEHSISKDVRKQQDYIHQRVGLLIASWANTESLFLKIVYLLIGSSENVSEVIYFSFESNSGRQRLVERLGVTVLPKNLQNELDSIREEFAEFTILRNELAHCEYIVDKETYAYIGTATSKIRNLKTTPITKTTPFDEARFEQIRQAVAGLNKLNRKMIKFISKLQNAKSPP